MPNLIRVPWAAMERSFALAAEPGSAVPLSSHGFSGARLWSVACQHGPPLVIRRLPPGVRSARLAEIQAVLEHVFQEGCDFVPVPRRTRDTTCFVQFRDHLWQVEPRLPGVANFHAAPTVDRVRGAMRALAQWHLAAQSFDLPRDAACSQTRRPAPGLVVRLERLHEVAKTGGIADQLAKAQQPADVPNLSRFRTDVLQAFRAQHVSLRQRIEVALQKPIRVHYCIRDVHHDHVLFQDATSPVVTGLVDYDAMRVDSVAADLSRLLRSMLDTGPDDWLAALDDYAQLRSLDDQERNLLAAYDDANRLLSGIQWLQWVLIERRQFDWQHVLPRLEMIKSRL